jgi:hypothetical protein
MPQLHLYVSDDVAEHIRSRARAKRLSVSQYLAEVVEQQVVAEWPEVFFAQVVGQWRGPLKRAPQGKLEAREEF